MSQSVAPADTTAVAPAPLPTRPPRASFNQKLLYGYIGLAIVLAAASIAAGAINPAAAYSLTLMIAGGVACACALVSAIATWRNRTNLAGAALSAWALALLVGGTLTLDTQRALWFAMAVVPATCAMLFLPPLGTLAAGLLSLGAVWALNFTVLPAPTDAQINDWLVLSGGMALAILIITSGSAMVHRLRRSISQQNNALDEQTQKVSGEQERVERMTAQWADQRDRLAAVLDAAPDGIVLADASGTITTANAEARQLLNETAGSALEGQKLSLWTHDIAGRTKIIATEREGDRERVLFEQLTGANHIVSLSQVPIRSTNGGVIGMVGVFHNQTNEAELEQMRSQFLDLLVQDMHDPLNSILAAHDTLLAGDIGEGNERVITAARRTTTRLIDLVRTLLEMSKLQNDPTTLHRTPHPLRPLVESSIAQVTPLAQQRAINLVLEYGVDGGPILFEPDKMRRVMLNLLDNALKHSPAYSTIRVQANQTNGVAQIRISDQGSGIPAEYTQRLFERFGKVGGDQRLGGLGLAFCKLVVEAHGGRIWVESSPGKGSTFAFSLPA